MNMKLERERVRQKEIEELEAAKKTFQSDDQTPDSDNLVKEIDRRLEILKDGPKGFQAEVTETTLKVLRVPKEE